MGCPRRSPPAAWSTWSASGRWAGPCRWMSAASTTTMSSTSGHAARTSARRTGRRATGRSCGRAASRGSSAAAGRWAGCTCSACWRWPTARARSSSPNPTWCATRSWSPPLRRWRARRGIELVVLNPKQMAAEDYAAALHAAHGGRGFDDIVVIVASTPAIEAALPQLAPDGLLVIFGGLARGTMAALDLSQRLPGRDADHRLGRLHDPRPGVRAAEGRRGAPLDGQRRGRDRRAGRRARRDAGADGRPLPRQDGHLPAGGVLPAHRAG